MAGDVSPVAMFLFKIGQQLEGSYQAGGEDQEVSQDVLSRYEAVLTRWEDQQDCETQPRASIG